MVMPSPGAVWPAMVTLLATAMTLVMRMTPPTSKTTVRLGDVTPVRNEPAPVSLRLVT